MKGGDNAIINSWQSIYLILDLKISKVNNLLIPGKTWSRIKLLFFNILKILESFAGTKNSDILYNDWASNLDLIPRLIMKPN
jgi:hypothetical protein